MMLEIKGSTELKLIMEKLVEEPGKDSWKLLQADVIPYQRFHCLLSFYFRSSLIFGCFSPYLSNRSD